MAWIDKYVTADAAGGGDGSSGSPWTITEAIASVAAGQRVNVAAGSYPNMAADYAFATAGTATAPIWWRGYKTTIGDLDSAGGSRVAGTDLPLWNADTTTDQIVISGAHQIFSNIAITSICTDAGGAVNASGGNLRMIRCSITNTQPNSASKAFAATGTASISLVGCYLKATTTATRVVDTSVTASLIGCVVEGGVVGVYRSAHVIGTVIFGFTTAGWDIDTATSAAVLSNCTIYSNGGTNGVRSSVAITTGAYFFHNCIIGGCTNGINNTAASNVNGIYVVGCQFYGCTNNLVNITEQSDVTDALTASLFNIDSDTDPFTAKASGNFTLLAGAAARQAGFPRIYDNTSMIGYPDIGAVQAQALAPSGSSYAFIG